jgi:TolB-like protein/dienelactone hydrolase
MNILAELKRRKVYQVAAIYAGAAWGLLQIADIIFPRLGLPDWSITFLFALEVVGFPLALILSWIFDYTPGGVVLTGAQPRRAGSLASESLAVLPFNNMSDDTSLEHFADGLVEDLITHLQRDLTIPVNSRNSTFVYKGTAVDVVKIAEDLGAAFVVEGSVRMQGDTVRVTAQLIDAAKDHHVWAENWDRPLDDIFALQDELVEAVVAAIARHIPGSDTTSAKPEADKPVGVHKRWVALAAVLLLGLSTVLTWSLEQRRQERHAREVVMPEIEKLIEADDQIAAYTRITEILELLPSDPLLLKYRDKVSWPANIRTDPAGVQVSYQPYGTESATWQALGVSPVEQVRLPYGYLQLRFEGDGLLTSERLVRNPSFLLENFPLPGSSQFGGIDSTVHLAPADSSREGMVYVSPWDGPIALPWGIPDAKVTVPGFYIDTYEVTNVEFQEFVDAGGYDNSRYWDGMDFGGASWPEAVQAFTDQTGQPGPAGWEAGRFPHGAGQHPVTGVSWFEASAYARFRGKELPTFYHWYRAAMDYMELLSALGPAIIKHSNYSGESLAAVGQYRGMSFFGAYDMGGNAREWLLNADNELRWIVGGAWNQTPYMLNQADFASPFDRGPTNGFRCVLNAGDIPTPEELKLATTALREDTEAQPQPVSDEVYAVFRDQFGYVKGDPQARLVTSRDRSDWREEKIHINSPYSEEGMDLLLLLPGQTSAPLHAMVLMPGADVFSTGASMDGRDWANYESSVTAVLRSGRAVVIPYWAGAFSRGRQLTSRGLSDGEFVELTRVHIAHWRQDLGSTLDYLDTRDDIDSSKVGFLGISYGASMSLAILGMEPRLKTAILVAGGIWDFGFHPLVTPQNHLPRITMPVLMMNGRYDYSMPLASTQEPLYQMLGSAAGQKKHVLYDAGHVGFPVNQQRREIMMWLDTYLGKVR